jgi:hypothetical protein
MPVLHVVRVFCDSKGQFGSPLGVVLDGSAILPERRQPLAAELGFSETVYVDDPDTGQLRIFTPAAELPFAGHPLVGTAWLLSRHLRHPVTQLNPPAGPVPTWIRDDQVWIRAPLAAAPPWRLNHVADAIAVDAMTEPPHPDQDADQFWAWIDQRAGTVRARVFAARLGRTITIHHGSGSVIQASPAHNDMADVGGHVVWDHERAVE